MSNNNLDPTLIKDALRHIPIKNFEGNIIDNSLLSALIIKDNHINLVIELPAESKIDQESLTESITKVISLKYPNLKDIRVVFSSPKKNIPKPQNSEKILQNIPKVKKIILLAATKGGVGKSTTATNIALALNQLGFKVGLVDGDIYGPTIPKLLAINEKPEILNGKMLPIKKRGIYSISIGYLISESQATIWRGPMVSKSLYQLLLGTAWPELDYLIIDMPPGTGDVYLSIAENFVIDGVILITTPQNIALTMIQKSIDFFNKTNIPLVGIVENMSYFFDPENNITHYIFGPSLVKKLDLKLLGQIPLSPKISQFNDQGFSLVQEKEFLPYLEIAKNLF